MKIRVFLDCKEAGHVCDKAQYEEAAFFDKCLLGLHILYCRACRSHSMRNHKLTQLMKRAKVQTIDQQEKERLQDLIRKELSE